MHRRFNFSLCAYKLAALNGTDFYRLIHLYVRYIPDLNYRYHMRRKRIMVKVGFKIFYACQWQWLGR